MKTFRIWADIYYKAPRYDALGIPANDPVHNPDPDINILADDLAEFIAEVTAPDQPAAECKVKDLLLHPHNSHVLDIAITDVVEL